MGNVTFSSRFYGMVDEPAVFNYATSDKEDEYLYKCPLAKKYDPAVAPQAGYRGGTTFADTGNTGWVGGIRVNPGDYVIYNGLQQAEIWEYSYMYRWDGMKWAAMPSEQNWDKYLEGVSDLTAGAPMGVFSTAFIESLFVESLKATVVKIKRQLSVGKDSNGILLDGQKGEIKSNYEKDTSGFLLRGSDGYAEFNNIRSNNIQSMFGYFEDATGKNMTFKGGTIDIGPLYVSDSFTFGKGATYAEDYDLQAFVNEYLPRNPTPSEEKLIYTLTTSYYGGKYGSYDLYSITFTKERVATAPQTFITSYTAAFNRDGGTTQKKYDGRGYGDTTIGAKVVIKAGPGGKTFQLNGLPESDPHEKGKLYCNGATGQVFISLG
jgi:hypothetical protein